MATNLEVLKEKGCIPKDAELSEAEKAVVEGMSPEEVQVLVDIRQRLDEETAKRGTTAIASGEVAPSTNIIV